MNSIKQNSSETEEEPCCVCFKTVEIFSIGDCDHPVCYECSIRMRVLCQQNECPICRQVLSKVIFTTEKLPFRELETRNRSDYYNKKYKIAFCSQQIQGAFYKLLEHPCPCCDALPYRTIEGLQNHVRKQHNLYYCDLCIDNLKIFTFERRCYTQSELHLHRTKGDPDNKSHRGHPLCEYCEERYLDRDELFRHLRREHYYCHFCDADGFNEFYKDYNALAQHFRQDHFLCEEGKCAKEQFIGAFRTEIDYKAHVANVHGNLLNKQQAKQTRTLQLEITLGPRGRSTQNEPNLSNLRSRPGNEEQIESEFTNYDAFTMQRERPVVIDEREFPSLSGSSGPNLSLTQPLPISMRHRTGTAGLARTKENFPALGAGGGNATGKPSAQRAPISSVLRQQSISSANGAVARNTTTASTNSNASGMVVHVSNRPTSNLTNNGGANKKSTKNEFPALPISNKNKKAIRALKEDMLPSTSNTPTNSVASKHRSLVADDYVSVANPLHFQKIQMVQKEEIDAKAEKIKALKLTNDDFPTLGGGSVSMQTNQTNSWKKALSDKRQRELENKKSKIAPAPILPNNNNYYTNNNNGNKQVQTTKNKVHNGNNATLPTEPIQKKEKKVKEKKSLIDSNIQNKTVNGKNQQKFNNNYNEQKHSNNIDLNEQKSSISLPNGDNLNEMQNNVRPPPGFDANILRAPHSYQSNVKLNSIAKLPNNLTFTSSMGESYDISPTTYLYIEPPEASTRNRRLYGIFQEVMKSPEALDQFRHISNAFREGVYKAIGYYEHCQSALGDKFDNVFPEVLALLPDISKQQALYLVHTQRLNAMPAAQRKALTKLEVCSVCKQVLLTSDFGNHIKLHEMRANFPSLSGGGVGNTGKTTNRN